MLGYFIVAIGNANPLSVSQTYIANEVAERRGRERERERSRTNERESPSPLCTTEQTLNIAAKMADAHVYGMTGLNLSAQILLPCTSHRLVKLRAPSGK